MIKKFLGNANVTKLRAILLLEADFNTLHKIVLNGRLMPELEVREEIQQETIRGRRT